MGVFGAYPGGNPSIPTQAYADPAKFGAAQNGTTDDSGALAAIATQANGNPVTVIVYGPLGLNSYSPPANLAFQFIPGGYLKRLSSATITYNNNILLAGPQKIMDITNTGSYVGTVQVNGGYEEWMGAKADNATLCSDSMNALRAFSHQAGDFPIYGLPGTYLLDKLVYGNGVNSGSATAPSYRGIGFKRTYWSHAGLAHGIKFIGGSGLPQDCTYEHMSLTGDASSTGVIMAGVVGYKLHRVGFENQLVGWSPSNELSGHFTEYCEALACDFRVNVATALSYLRAAGNDSFNGTGLNQRCTVNIPNNGTGIQIASGCKTYIAPLNAQFWTNGAGAASIITNNSGTQNTFAGEISYECNSGTLTGGSGSTVSWFTGEVIGTSDAFSAGLLRRSPGGVLNIFSDGSIRNFGGTAGLVGAIVTGANTVPSLYPSYVRLVELQVQSSTFDYEFTVLVRPSGYGTAGLYTVISSLIVISGGTPLDTGFSFSVNSAGNLILTNASLPASGTTAVVFETTLDSGHLPNTKHITA
jgi:hypothetical protein